MVAADVGAEVPLDLGELLLGVRRALLELRALALEEGGDVEWEGGDEADDDFELLHLCTGNARLKVLEMVEAELLLRGQQGDAIQCGGQIRLTEGVARPYRIRLFQILQLVS